jgi:hypothetical protein
MPSALRVSCVHSSQHRFLSTATGPTTTATAPTASGSPLEETKADKDSQKKKVDDNKSGNIFLDYLGTIFLAGLGLIVVALVRSYNGGNNRNRMREDIEQQTPLDPLEIDDLRLANSDLTLDVFRQVQAHLLLHNADSGVVDDGDGGSRQMLYAEFVRAVRTALRNIKNDDAFTVELGHYMDRVVLEYMSRRGQVTTRDPQPLSFWMTLLSMALSAPVPDRILALYEVVAKQASRKADEAGGGRVTVADTRSLVRHLQNTCQLTPDTQVVEDVDAKYPIQQYQRGDVGKLFQWDGSDSDELDIDAFAAILRSRAVCVWGECYHKRKVV